MSAPAVKVGDTAVHVARFHCTSPRFIRDVRIVRETPTQWVDDIGTRWRKSTGEQTPQYAPEPRYLMTREAFDAAKGDSHG